MLHFLTLFFELNNMKKVIIFLTIVFCSISYSKAQFDFRKGFVVNNNNDTIYGLIDYAKPQSNARFCFYKKEVISKVIKYAPSDLVAYGFVGDNQYVSKLIPIKGDSIDVFLEYLVNGIVDLYYYRVPGRKYYYIEKNSQLYQLTNKKIVVQHRS